MLQTLALNAPHFALAQSEALCDGLARLGHGHGLVLSLDQSAEDFPSAILLDALFGHGVTSTAAINR